MNSIISMTGDAGKTECHDVRVADIIQAVRSEKWREPIENMQCVSMESYASDGGRKEIKLQTLDRIWLRLSQ
jgi:hypothetical protein